MKKHISKILVIVMAVAAIGILSGCPPYPEERNYQYKDAWLYYFVGDGVAVVSVIDPIGAANEDGVIVIPSYINGHRVVHLGDPPRGWGMIASFYSGTTRVNRIVVPEGIFITDVFWRDLSITDYVELLDETPNLSVWGIDGGRITLIVPDGSRQAYINHFRSSGTGSTISPMIVERSAVWRYYELGHNEVRLASVLDLSAVTDEYGVLTIPSQINGRRVVSLGSNAITDYRQMSNRIFYRGGRTIERIIIPEGIYVQQTFWAGLLLTDFVEFLADSPNFERLGSAFDTQRMTLIVPYGRATAYRTILGNPTGLTIIEQEEVVNDE